MSYTLEQLEKDKATFQHFLDHEIKKLSECEDDATKKLLEIRVKMYQRNVVDIEKALEVISKADLYKNE